MAHGHVFLMSSVQQRRISLAVLICQASVSKAEAFFLTALCGLTSNVLQFCWTTGCAFGWFMGVRYGSAVLPLNSWVYWVRLRALFSMKDSFPITQWADPHCARELHDIDFVEADAEADTSFCRVCHATSQTPGNVPGLASMKMVTKSKCWFCHATHLLAYGDTTWKDCSNISTLDSFFSQYPGTWHSESQHTQTRFMDFFLCRGRCFLCCSCTYFRLWLDKW